MAQVRVTFDKEFISGDKTLFAKIKKADHGYPIHHDCGDNYMTYYTEGDKPEPKQYIGADGKLYAKLGNYDGTISGRSDEAGTIIVNPTQEERKTAIKANPDDRYKRQEAS